MSCRCICNDVPCVCVCVLLLQAESEGFSHFHLYVCAAFLIKWRKEILSMLDFQVLECVCVYWSEGGGV